VLSGQVPVALKAGSVLSRTISVWANVPEPQRKVVRGLLAFLEDRRVLYNPYNIEIEREVSESVLEIRRELTRAIQALPEDSPAAPALRAMRAACREYLDGFQRLPHHMGFMLALGELRAHFGLQIAFLAIGIAPVFRTLSIDGMMISEVCDAKEAIQRCVQA